MTSSKNPVREFIEILRRIRTGHENLKVSSGIPGFIPGTGERVDAFSTALPWESATPDGLFTLKGDKPENPEGLGFAIEIFPQTGVLTISFFHRKGVELSTPADYMRHTIRQVFDAWYATKPRHLVRRIERRESAQ